MLLSETTINSSDEDHKLMDKETESMYSFDISLTIIGVKPSDLGNYTCEARNSYGTVRGTIQLESMYFLPNVFQINFDFFIFESRWFFKLLILLVLALETNM